MYLSAAEKRERDLRQETNAHKTWRGTRAILRLSIFPGKLAHLRLYNLHMGLNLDFNLVSWLGLISSGLKFELRLQEQVETWWKSWSESLQSGGLSGIFVVSTTDQWTIGWSLPCPAGVWRTGGSLWFGCPVLRRGRRAVDPTTGEIWQDFWGFKSLKSHLAVWKKAYPWGMWWNYSHPTEASHPINSSHSSIF